MRFVRLDGTTVLNLDSVASIGWEVQKEGLVAVVKYLVRDANAEVSGSQLVREKLTGAAAYALQQFLESPGGAEVSRTPSDRTSFAPPVPGRETSPGLQSLDMLVSGNAKKKAWFYIEVDGVGYILAMVNMKGSCSMRTFNAKSGRFLGKQYARGSYSEQFARYLQSAKELSIDRQPNLERDCREQLSESVLSYFANQLPHEKPGF